MAQALDIKTGSPLTKLILLKLCDNANDNGECWPSQNTIADQCETSRATVNRHIKILVDKGFVRVVSQTRHGMKTVSKYHINLGCSTELQRCNRELQPDVTESYIEPIIEPTNTENYIKTFEDWWEIYPKKISKKVAYKAFKAAVKKEDAHTIIVGLIGHDCLKAEHQYCPYPATWLNQERWKDDCGPNYKDLPFHEKGQIYIDQANSRILDVDGNVSLIWEYDASIKGAVML